MWSTTTRPAPDCFPNAPTHAISPAHSNRASIHGWRAILVLMEGSIRCCSIELIPVASAVPCLVCF